MSIYLDHAATTPMPEWLREVYTQALTVVGNPSSIHQSGQHARDMLEQARAQIATLIGVDPMEVVFTSGGTEASNMWIKGRVFAHRQAHPSQEPPYLLLTRAEHHATLDAVEWLQKMRLAQPLWIEVDSEGVMSLDALEQQLSNIDPSRIAGITSLVANNEVGSIQPVAKMSQLAKDAGEIPAHLDAIQAFGHVPIDFRELAVDAMSITGHKLGAPIGVGALILSRHAAPIEPLIHGGGQQPSRSGTLDAAGAVVFAAALERALSNREAHCARARELRDRLLDGLTRAVSGVSVRGSIENRLCVNAHVTVEGAEGEVMLYLFDSFGVSVSTGSACQAGVAEASHVLLAMGLDERSARGALRFSIGESTTLDEIDRVIELFPEVVERARQAGYSEG